MAISDTERAAIKRASREQLEALVTDLFVLMSGEEWSVDTFEALADRTYVRLGFGLRAS